MGPEALKDWNWARRKVRELLQRLAAMAARGERL
jgi:hypothetical protein